MTQAPSRTHVIVLFGGESAEHDVSCVTAAHVLRALDADKYRVTAVGITRTGAWMLATDAMAAPMLASSSFVMMVTDSFATKGSVTGRRGRPP